MTATMAIDNPKAVATRARLMPWARASPRAGPRRPPSASNDWMIPTTVPNRPKERPQCRHRAQDPQIALELDHLSRCIVTDDLPNRHPGLPPGIDHDGKDACRRALVSTAQLECSLTVELAARETFEKAVDELMRDHAFAPQRGEPFHHISQCDDRTDRQRPEHGIGVQQEPKDAGTIHAGFRHRRGLVGRLDGHAGLVSAAAAADGRAFAASSFAGGATRARDGADRTKRPMIAPTTRYRRSGFPGHRFCILPVSNHPHLIACLGFFQVGRARA